MLVEESKITRYLAPVELETAQKLGISPQEFDKIFEYLGRKPNFTELSVYSVLWSEHCSYKNSILWLKKLPKTGRGVMAAAGEENAGLLDIGGGLAVCFKIESHNHPSAIEPYQGAATGVGGIHRDIFTMGARPIAALNSLRFGDPALAQTRRLVKGVVKGIGDYGNAFGVPTVGGEVFFHPCYNTNPLVNAMSVGIVKHDGVMSATAKGVGNPVYIVGSATGKDGIHGATFASQDIHENSVENLPAVQVGDPFQEKLLLEATLEAIATGAVVGMQDMGAAGIACSTSEMSARGKVGMVIDLDAVPTRQPNMAAFEILLSESQERMLVVVHKGQEAAVEAVFDKWDLPCVKIGEVTNDGYLRYRMGGQEVGVIPADSLVLGGGAPVYQREIRQPAYTQFVADFNPQSIPVPTDLNSVISVLLSNPSIASKHWISRQYDSMVGAATISAYNPASAAMVAIHGTEKALSLTVDCNPRYVYLEPRKGCAHAVAEAARNIAATGARPLGVTNCLNFGNPYNPEVYWQFSEAILGMKDACEAFGIPVTGGNVSFYNQSEHGSVYPTPTIGMVGVLENVKHRIHLAFRKPAEGENGDAIYILGTITDDIAGSTYLMDFHQIEYSPAPYLNLDEEVKLCQLMNTLAELRLVQSAQDISEGGLIVALLESAFINKTGFVVEQPTHVKVRSDSFWFGEGGGRIVVSVKSEHETQFLQTIYNMGVTCTKIGAVHNCDIIIQENIKLDFEALKSIFTSTLAKKLGVE